MEQRTGPLRTPADLERALAEARQMLDGLEQAGPAAAKRFDELLKRISEYRGPDPPTPQSPEHQERQNLDDHLKAFGRRWGDGQARDPSDHWRSMLGGDLSPKRPTRG
jgi:hypothetical protein